MKIYIANDHSAVELKEEIKEYLKKKYEIIDLGTKTNESVDYPNFANKVASEVVKDNNRLGILICGTGVGMSIAANKVNGIRAVVCSEPYSAKLSKEHNHSNVLCLGSRVVGVELAKMIVSTWLDAVPEAGRHSQRIELIESMENQK